mmetsp:Transcript_7099/g.6636  ORF Transcript_7099/g.6636 Transcript_7099/m.6636 type:complete len:207 (-) Transcript_7099:140-760(-)
MVDETQEEDKQMQPCNTGFGERVRKQFKVPDLLRTQREMNPSLKQNVSIADTTKNENQKESCSGLKLKNNKNAMTRLRLNPLQSRGRKIKLEIKKREGGSVGKVGLAQKYFMKTLKNISNGKGRDKHRSENESNYLNIKYTSFFGKQNRQISLGKLKNIKPNRLNKSVDYMSKRRNIREEFKINTSRGLKDHTYRNTMRLQKTTKK